MQALAVLRHEARKAYSWLDGLVSTVPAEMAAWQPPGTANSIAANYAHAVIAADVDLHLHFHGVDPLIAGPWAGLGVGATFPDDFRGIENVEWDALRAYGRDVGNAVVSLTERLTEADLDRVFEMRAFIPGSDPPALRALGMWKGIDIYTLHGGGHIWMHGGEIAALKGMQGAQGYGDFLDLYD